MTKCCSKPDPVHYDFRDRSSAWICVRCKTQLAGKTLDEDTVEALAMFASFYRDKDNNQPKKGEKQMKVSEAKFTRRYNVGQYEHEEYSVTAVVEDGDKATEVLATLKEDVRAAYAGESSTAAAPAATTGKPPKKGKGKPAPEPEDPEVEDEEESEDEEEQNDADGESDLDDEDSETEDESEEEAEAAASKPAKSGKTGKTFKKKPQVYQRTNESHKDIFSNLLKAVAPDWKKTTESKAKGKEASKKMEGKDFLDENGEVLPEFKAAVKKLMGKK